jgi:hypothetical protein
MTAVTFAPNDVPGAICVSYPCRLPAVSLVVVDGIWTGSGTCGNEEHVAAAVQAALRRAARGEWGRVMS